MNPARPAALLVAALLAGCAPGTSPGAPAPPPVASTPVATASPAVSSPDPADPPVRPTTSAPEPTPSLPVEFPITASLLDGAAARVVQQLHTVSGLRPALKLDVSEDEVTLTVLTRSLQARSYRWRDGLITLAETDVEYLRQTIFWPTDFALDNVRLLFDNAALLGTSSTGQVLQVVEYRPGHVYMSVTSNPESSTIFFRKDGSVFQSLGVTSVTDIREGIDAVTQGSRSVHSIGFDARTGYFAELSGRDGSIERHARIANQPMFISRRSGTTSLAPFDPRLLDPSAIAKTIAEHDGGGGCAVAIDNRFERVQPVITYTCDGKVHHSDLKGRDLTSQLR